MADSIDWRVRKGSATTRLSDRLVVQGRRPGMLDLSVCVLASGEIGPRSLGLLVPLAAACTSEGIRRDTGIVSWLHWPNLVTIDGRVVAQTSVRVAAPPKSGGKAQVVIRLSVDCFARGRTFASGLPNTSILRVLGVEIDVDLLRDKVLHALNWYYAEWERGVHRKLVDRMEPTIFWLGRDVVVATLGGRALKGRASGLDDDGSLLLEQKAGSRSPKTLALTPASVRMVRLAH